MHELTQFLVEMVDHFGYAGIFFATFIESTFVPIPAEATMLPAGILAAQGKLNYWLVLLSSTGGVVVGSLLNYWLGMKYGRILIQKYGRYVFLKETFLDKTEAFFRKHGAFTVFMGRLLPGIRHYIAFPAGIARMNLTKFTTYTALGGAIWMWILLQIGFMMGAHVKEGVIDSGALERGVLILIASILLCYLARHKLMKH